MHDRECTDSIVFSSMFISDLTCPGCLPMFPQIAQLRRRAIKLVTKL